MATSHTLEVTEYTDPYCTWCWGSEPILRKIEEVYGDQVKISFKMGGLVADMSTFRDASNGIGGPKWYAHVADHWLDASHRHGMPVDGQIFFDLKDTNFSTYPASIAYKLAQFQDEALANKFLRRMREAAAAERGAIHRLDVQVELVEKVGLNPDQFTRDIESGKAREAFEEDLEERRKREVRVFPTFLIRNLRDNRELTLKSYQQFGNFVEAFRLLAGDAVQPDFTKASKDSIFAFVLKHTKVAPKEISEVFMIGEKEIDEYLVSFISNGTIQKIRVGNGYFYTA